MVAERRLSLGRFARKTEAFLRLRSLGAWAVVRAGFGLQKSSLTLFGVGLPVLLELRAFVT